MGKFESELHILCEEAKWPEVCSILKSILESDRLAQEGSDSGDEYDVDTNANNDNAEQRYHLQQPPRSPRRNGINELQSFSSVAPTCTNTSEPATLYEADSSDEEDSYAGSLRCSYEKSRDRSEKQQQQDGVSTIFESSNPSILGEDATTTTTTPEPIMQRRPSISSTENNVEKLPTPSFLMNCLPNNFNRTNNNSYRVRGQINGHHSWSRVFMLLLWYYHY